MLCKTSPVGLSPRSEAMQMELYCNPLYVMINCKKLNHFGGLTMSLKFIPAFDHADSVRELFTEYTDMLIAGDPDFAAYLLNIQHFDDELLHLENKYGPPSGRLYLAYWNDELAGCVGLKKVDNDNAEIKRLYVRPAFRGHRIGDEMVHLILQDARKIGYSHVLLDTLPFLKTAIAMYRRLGFYDIPSYNGSPMKNLLYMQYDL